MILVECGMCHNSFNAEDLTEDGLCDDCINKKYLEKEEMEQRFDIIIKTKMTWHDAQNIREKLAIEHPYRFLLVVNSEE